MWKVRTYLQLQPQLLQCLGQGPCDPEHFSRRSDGEQKLEESLAPARNYRMFKMQEISERKKRSSCFFQIPSGFQAGFQIRLLHQHLGKPQQWLEMPIIKNDQFSRQKTQGTLQHPPCGKIQPSQISSCPSGARISGHICLAPP